MRTEDLEPIVAELVTKPGHEKVRSHLFRLLTDGLGADATSVDFERPLPEVRGRIDALLGRTVFEIKRDLARERGDAEAQLSRYLPEREADTGQRFVGIATDGAEFRVYMVRDGRLDELGQFKPKVSEPRGLLGWLESVVALNDEIPPDVISIQHQLGRHSVAYHRAIREIEALWNDLKDDPEANLKRDLWNRLLRVAYGTDIEAPALFFQHTYLTIVAKAIATVALLDTLPASGATLLEGKPFRDLGIVGAVESDFFDWVLLHPKGGDLVMEIARQANRFRLRDIRIDILKGLYESLIDPEQRHDLGEYYTPDWLAQRICEAAIHDPLNERVIDPACGSGTFLFHAIRRLIAAAEAADFSPADAIARAGEKVAGIDIHPVAVIFARATYLLALMPTLQRGRPGSLSVPVYLGDALQWNARQFMNLQDLEIVVPAQGEAARAEGGTISIDDSGKRVILRFPLSLASQRGLFDEALGEILSLAERDQPTAALSGWLARKGFEDSSDVRMLLDTYEALRTLRKEGRDHLWGYVARNLSRPVWLASDAQKADVVVGNPPWLRYSSMSAANKQKFQEETVKAGLWVGGKYATAQDLSSYFFARSVYLYMRQDGRIAFVMPYAAMSREPYRLFRKGGFKEHAT
ncbi:MAG: N-6 DNA methylase [Geminicoccaceae bacterium]